MLKKVSIGLAAAVVLLMIVVAFQSADYKIERSITINARANIVFSYVSDVRLVNSWNPWLELDPKTVVSYQGPNDGVGAISTWKGDHNVGAGKVTTIESLPNEYVKTKLEFFEPMASTATGEYILKTDGPTTTLTWTMSGKNSFFSRLLCVFMNMDKMVGGQFEKGLTTLKNKVEASNKGTK